MVRRGNPGWGGPEPATQNTLAKLCWLLLGAFCSLLHSLLPVLYPRQARTHPSSPHCQSPQAQDTQTREVALGHLNPLQTRRASRAGTCREEPVCGGLKSQTGLQPSDLWSRVFSCGEAKWPNRQGGTRVSSKGHPAGPGSPHTCTPAPRKKTSWQLRPLHPKPSASLLDPTPPGGQTLSCPREGGTGSACPIALHMGPATPPRTPTVCMPMLAAIPHPCFHSQQALNLAFPICSRRKSCLFMGRKSILQK